MTSVALTIEWASAACFVVVGRARYVRFAVVRTRVETIGLSLCATPGSIQGAPPCPTALPRDVFWRPPLGRPQGEPHPVLSKRDKRPGDFDVAAFSLPTGRASTRGIPGLSLRLTFSYPVASASRWIRLHGDKGSYGSKTAGKRSTRIGYTVTRAPTGAIRRASVRLDSASEKSFDLRQSEGSNRTGPSPHRDTAPRWSSATSSRVPFPRPRWISFSTKTNSATLTGASGKQVAGRSRCPTRGVLQPCPNVTVVLRNAPSISYTFGKLA